MELTATQIHILFMISVREEVDPFFFEETDAAFLMEHKLIARRKEPGFADDSACVTDRFDLQSGGIVYISSRYSRTITLYHPKGGQVMNLAVYGTCGCRSDEVWIRTAGITCFQVEGLLVDVTVDSIRHTVTVTDEGYLWVLRYLVLGALSGRTTTPKV
jgi:hypothetical protein